jgi:tRNA threonylcarbamoyladenosine biosynthesis protein TsaB
MKLLAIDTSSSACSVALLLNDKLIAHHEMAPMQQTQKILPMIDQILKSENVKLNQLDALAFGCGPGSFTGVRLATSVMQGIGFANDLPLIPISSLAALAQAAYQDLGWRKLLVAADARIQEVYSGAYIVNQHDLVELQGKEVVCPPHELVLPTKKDWYGVGDGWKVYRESINYEPVEIDSSRLPLASGVAVLAKQYYQANQWVSPENAHPTYLRDQVAIKSKKQ